MNKYRKRKGEEKIKNYRIERMSKEEKRKEEKKGKKELKNGTWGSPKLKQYCQMKRKIEKKRKERNLFKII